MPEYKTNSIKIIALLFGAIWFLEVGYDVVQFVLPGVLCLIVSLFAERRFRQGI